MQNKENDVVALLVARFGFGKRYAQRIAQLMGPEGVKKCEAGDFSGLPVFKGPKRKTEAEQDD